MVKNFWLGDNELVIVLRGGTYCVIEAYENWEKVFTGSFQKCLEYCKRREVSYLESIVG